LLLALFLVAFLTFIIEVYEALDVWVPFEFLVTDEVVHSQVWSFFKQEVKIIAGIINISDFIVY